MTANTLTPILLCGWASLKVFEPVFFKLSEDVLRQKFRGFFYRKNVFAFLTLHFHLKEVPS